MALKFINTTNSIKINGLRTDGGTQIRERINGSVVKDYADAIMAGDQFPEITVFFDGNDYWLADGFHRLQAHQQAGLEEIPADIRQGTQRDAMLFAAGANSAHGLQRTRKEARAAVFMLLNDPEWAKWSDREIGRRCGVHHGTVASIRAAIAPNDDDGIRTYVRNGKQTYMRTGNIGGSQAPAPEDGAEGAQDGAEDAQQADPVKRYTGTCSICHRPLTSEESVKRGMGDTCAGHAEHAAGVAEAKAMANGQPAAEDAQPGDLVNLVVTAELAVYLLQDISLLQWAPQMENELRIAIEDAIDVDAMGEGS